MLPLAYCILMTAICFYLDYHGLVAIGFVMCLWALHRWAHPSPPKPINQIQKTFDGRRQQPQ